MAQIKLHPDFRDFLKLLNSHGVKYLIVGGYAVGYYGYPRATGNMDVWIAVDAENAAKTASALREFGMPKDEVTETLFLQEDAIIRIGIPPVRIEIITNASGVDFSDCYEHRVLVKINEITVNFISLDDLKRNKKACGRHKDLDDLEHLP
jgi:predicted nucleotidyltransferase